MGFGERQKARFGGHKKGKKGNKNGRTERRETGKKTPRNVIGLRGEGFIGL